MSRVTRHIPMKRELKVRCISINHNLRDDSHKAYPDEKGTERFYLEDMSICLQGLSQGISR